MRKGPVVSAYHISSQALQDLMTEALERAEAYRCKQGLGCEVLRLGLQETRVRCRKELSPNMLRNTLVTDVRRRSRDIGDICQRLCSVPCRLFDTHARRCLCLVVGCCCIGLLTKLT